MKKQTHSFSLIMALVLLALINSVGFKTFPVKANKTTQKTNNHPVLYLPLILKDHDIWPAVVILNPPLNPDYPYQIPWITWSVINGAQYYQVRLVSLISNTETFEEIVPTNSYNVIKDGHWKMAVRAGDLNYWGPWSQPIIFTSTIGSVFNGATPALLSPLDQSTINTAFPEFKWEPACYSIPFLDCRDDSFEFQLDDNADFSSQMINEKIGAGVWQKKLEKTYRMTTGEYQTSIVDNIQLHPGITYHWRVRQNFRDIIFTDWSTASFSVAEPYNDCLPIPTGKAVFSIQMGNVSPGWPIFSSGWVDPFDPAVETQQTVHIEAGIKSPQENPIQSVTFYSIYDSGQVYPHSATLVSGNTLTTGSWESTFTVPEESYCYNYIIGIKAVNQLGSTTLNFVTR